MKPLQFQKDTQAWVLQVWISFFAAVGASVATIILLPIELVHKGLIGVSFTFTVSSTFTLSKTIRDNQEAGRLLSRIDEAKVEKLLAKYDSLEN